MEPGCFRTIKVSELGHYDLLPIYVTYFAKMPISHETLNRIKSHSIKMNSKWRRYKFLLLGNSTWVSVAVTKIAKI